MQTTNFSSNSNSTRVRFPRIETKTRSLPGDKRLASLVDEITAKSWLYSSPGSEYGTRPLTQATRQALSARSPALPK